MADSITQSEFKEALGRYPSVVKKYSKPPKEGGHTLEELDQFRYRIAPASFSKKTGRTMELSDVLKLVEWKMKHGTFRPTLTKLVKSNSDEKVAAASKDAFTYYASHPTEIATVLEKLSAPLRGVGPAAASLLLSIHDPENIIFFSDELYSFLLFKSAKASPKYTTAEFTSLFAAVKKFQEKIKCSPQELEQVAFVLIRENEPVHQAAPKYVPSGKPRGRPPMLESERKTKPKPSVPGRGRGRPAGTGVTKKAAPKKAAAVKAETTETATPGKGRGRPAKATTTDDAEESNTPISAKKRGRPSKANDDDEEEEVSTPVSGDKKKRGRPSTASTASGKNAKRVKV